MFEKPRRESASRRAVRRVCPTNHFVARAVCGLAVIASVSACSSGPELTASVDTMVELESSLQCDITRFAHPDAEAIDGYRDEVRQRFGVTVEDHDIFLDMLTDDEDLRGRVADRADLMCPPPTADDVEES